ncbi:hypothetical protein B0T11DRAFT_286352 [Plectosphaerella cucumerina]|uniref:BZIP domain-containing protein n=1 Tax=Plectosphaerella cucumerina TaxID=40658 RepID=A0A8K0TAX1_9PEZI|nr:hypothetical protein B0T11DRAFT_286352 [Plectosphaerella cucumerina]
MSPQGSIFRIFNPASQSKEEAVQKRQEQLRRAQRVYRQRKTRYVKNLEAEIAYSRERECRWLAEKSALEDEVRGLLRLLDQHGIATPSAASLAGGSPRQLLTSPLSSNTYFSQDEHPEWPRASSLPLSSFDFQSPPETATSPRVCEMDHSILGMEFVLKIEEPCLDHVHGDPTKPDEPSGHALTATAQILSISSSPPPKRCSLLPVQDLPASILDRMLALAPEVATDDGITPVQAWDILRRKSSLENFTRNSLMVLAEKLRNSAKCHGFGAVLDFGVFNQVVGGVV